MALEGGDGPAVVSVDVLGPLRVQVDGRPVAVTASRLRVLLAVLAMAAGRALPVDRLAAAVWDDEMPGDPRRSLATYVARLRGTLGAESIVTYADGYALRAGPDTVDVLRFSQLLDAAATATAPAMRRARLEEALALWRGEPFEDLRSTWLARAEAPHLIERYLAAVEQRADLELAAGRAGRLVAELRELADRHPLREPLWTRLLAALHRTGRTAEALEAYEQIRRRIAGEMGVDPGPELRRAYTDLLAATGGERRVEAPRVPRQLPADVAGFAGRQATLKELDGLVGAGQRSLRVIVVSGAAGIGKTTVAVRWAHQVADRFPDGHLYADLRGFGPGDSPADPAGAIRRFLHALGVPSARVPADLEAQVALYRSACAGRRMLLLLDNARDADQVRPLLPGGPGCVAVVTSRDQLASLVAVEGAHPITLDLLPPDESRQLLGRRLGNERLAAEPAAVDDIVGSCGGLPLALAIAAARAATRVDFPLAAVAAQLRAARTDLDAFDSGDASGSLAAVFSWSYRALGAGAARLYRLQGVHPGPDVTAEAAASLAGVSVRQARRLLTDLCRAHLLVEHVPGRYRPHDLLRAYAADLARSVDSDADRRAALRRALDHYLHTACAAARTLDGGLDAVALAPAEPGVVPEAPDGYPAALGWFAAEHQVLLAAVDAAVGAGWDAHVSRLAWSLAPFLEVRGHWHDHVRAQEAALAASAKLGDARAQVEAHNLLALAYVRLGRPADTERHLARGLALTDRLGDPALRGQTLLFRSFALGGDGETRDVLRYAERAIEEYRLAGDRFGEARALNAAGWWRAQRGEYDQALALCERALTRLRELGDRHFEAHVWDSLGYIHGHVGDSEQAVACYRRAIELFRDLGNLPHQAISSVDLGDLHRAAGDRGAARAAWRAALDIFDSLDHPGAAPVRAKLAETVSI